LYVYFENTNSSWPEKVRHLFCNAYDSVYALCLYIKVSSREFDVTVFRCTSLKNVYMIFIKGYLIVHWVPTHLKLTTSSRTCFIWTLNTCDIILKYCITFPYKNKYFHLSSWEKGFCRWQVCSGRPYLAHWLCYRNSALLPRWLLRKETAKADKVACSLLFSFLTVWTLHLTL
jgi:hypothetical protein